MENTTELASPKECLAKNILEKKARQIATDLKVDNLFQDPQAALETLSGCFFDSGSTYSVSSLPEESMDILNKVNIDSEAGYQNNPLPPLPVLSSALLEPMLKTGKYQAMGLVDQDSVYNSNHPTNSLSRDFSRLNGNRTIRLGLQTLIEKFPDYEVVRWGGDEYVFLKKTNSPINNEEVADLRQSVNLIIGPNTYLEEKGRVRLKPITFKTEFFAGNGLEEKSSERQSEDSRNNSQQRIKELQKLRPELASFFSNMLSYSSEFHDAFTAVLEILENTYQDKLLHSYAKEFSNDEQAITCYRQAEDFANKLGNEASAHTLFCARLPNCLRQINKVSYHQGNSAIIKIFKTIVNNLPDGQNVNFFRRGSDFYFAVRPQNVPSTEKNLKPALDKLAQNILADTVSNTEQTITFAVLQRQDIEFAKDKKPLVLLGQAMDDMAEKENKMVFEQLQNLLNNDKKQGDNKVKQFLIKYFDLSDKRGKRRLEEINRFSKHSNPNFIEELTDSYQALIIGEKEAEKVILNKIISALKQPA